MEYQEATASECKVSDELATRASDDLIRYDPVYEVGRTGTGHATVVWHLMLAVRLADGVRWPYLLRRDYGGYAGDFPPGYIESLDTMNE